LLFVTSDQSDVLQTAKQSEFLQ